MCGCVVERVSHLSEVAILRSTLLIPLLLGCTPEVDVPAGDAPVLHRLTERQLNNALRDLFGDASLPLVDIPQDVPVHGFDNNALTRDATPYLVESIQRGLTELVALAVTDGGSWLSCAPGGGADPRACGHQTLEKLQQRAWRRPATADEKAWLLGLFDVWNSEVGFDEALQLSLLVLLQSPDFLYMVETGQGGQLTDWEVASRLSFFLWDTMPDAVLFGAAASGALSDRDAIRQQAQRLLQDERSRESVLMFHRQWLGFDYIQELDPDPAIFYPEDDGDDDAVGGRVSDLKAAYMAEFDLFVRHAVFERGTLDALLTSRQGYVSEQTAELYDVDVGGGERFTVWYPSGNAGEDIYMEVQSVTLPSEQRAGFLTQGAFLAGHSHPQQPSPVLRGVFLRERLLCVPPMLPPDDVPPLEADNNTDWTTNRERYAAHTDQAACAACHIAIDGVGFPFENYDALGGWRMTDNDAPVDASGELVGTDVDGPVRDAVELIETLASSRTVYDCAVTNVYRYGMHRSETDADAAALAALQENFWASGGVIPDLLVDFVSSEAFLSLNGGQR